MLLIAINQMHLQRNPKNAKVAVTTGILNLLNRDELEGVLAHELSHIKNRDILVSSIAAKSRMAFWGGGNRNRNTHPAIIILAFIAVIQWTKYLYRNVCSFSNYLLN